MDGFREGEERRKWRKSRRKQTPLQNCFVEEIARPLPFSAFIGNWNGLFINLLRAGFNSFRAEINTTTTPKQKKEKKEMVG